MPKIMEAQALLLKLDQAELLALRSLVNGESPRELALRLSIDLAGAVEIVSSMKRKMGAEQNADAVRVALYAGLAR